MVAATLSLSQADALKTLRAFLVGILPSGVPVIQGQANRVAEPAASDFVVYWPLRITRLETNEPSYFDNVIVGSISDTLLTVTGTPQLEGVGVAAGMSLTDGTAALLNGSTTVVAQLSGSVGGTGTYRLSPGNGTLGAMTLYAGQRQDLLQTEMVVQADCHGPNSQDVAQRIITLFRSEVAYDVFVEQPTGSTVVPLWCDEGRQLPFVNENQQVENRYVLELHMQINPYTGVRQDFADQLEPTLYEFK